MIHHSASISRDHKVNQSRSYKVLVLPSDGLLLQMEMNLSVWGFLDEGFLGFQPAVCFWVSKGHAHTTWTHNMDTHSDPLLSLSHTEMKTGSKSRNSPAFELCLESIHFLLLAVQG